MEPTNKSKTTPKDFFVYLGSTIVLYISVGSLISLIFDYINFLFPDVLENSMYYYDPYSASVRFSLSVLVILFPVFLFITHYINKDLRNNPEKKESGIRKWLLYLTLFLASVLVIGDLITLVQTFLNGEITSRFMYKVITVLVVSGITFYYYALDLKGRYIESPKTGYAFGILSFVFVITTIVSGFFIIGSPFNARLARFDTQKLQDLQNIQGQVLSYWQRNNALPKTLLDLSDSLAFGPVPTDAQTKASYEYIVRGDVGFDLCAVFNLDSKSKRTSPLTGTPYQITTGAFGEGNWQYNKGRYCFERTIDPKLHTQFVPTGKVMQ